jgi:hypothetical protein
MIRLEVRGGTASHNLEHRRHCALSRSKDGTSHEDFDMLLHGSRKDWRQDTNGTAKSDRQGEHGHPFRMKRTWVSLPINGDANCNKWIRSSSVYGGAFERLACQCDSPHLTAVHVNQVWAAPPLPQEASQSRHCVSSPSVTRPSAAGRGHRRYGYCLQHAMIEDSGSSRRGGW